MSKWPLFLMSVVSTLYLSNAYKILLVSPLPGKSHSILGEGVLNHLARAGHEVTYVASIVPDKPMKGVTVIDINGHVKLHTHLMNLKSIMDKTHRADLLTVLPSMVNMSRNVTNNDAVQKLLADKTQQFDVVIAEWMLNEVYAGFSGVFNCPLIWFSSVEPHWMVLQLVDEVPNPAYTVDISSGNVPPLTFSQRLKELSLQIFGKLIKTFYIDGIDQEIYEKHFVPHIRNRGYPVPPFEELRYNASLVLSNSHVSMGVATRLPPNYIPIGGYHIDPVVKPLPKDLQKIIDDAKHGFIYFSMGSNLRSKHLPAEVKQDLLNMFGELKQTVLWKFEEDLPNLPSNVHILKWAPQQSILAHEKCLLFITHGGLLSTTESIHFGVPTIGIPVFGDQFINVARGVKKGYAKKVDLSYTMAKDLKVAIQEMINDSRYMKKIKELSFIYHHRTVSPGQELVHWVEHVIKTGGARHLRTHAATTPWYQKVYLDLAIVLLIIMIATKYLFRYVCCSNGKKVSANYMKKQN
ncbi:UDP-glucosyltransferase 2-like isoform X2 [Vanessa cardui]|nr:UDP-glucosyltransferase 2-like isoform X2 [Vanessa cardui]XP_046972214.1 UDP-glucosyltransferase 2-like isoform X2 [Vanessa cardui]XP_046972215.1 UDP-glucosyltransferase 2-like isoform X2 [Vanessa cardui]